MGERGPKPSIVQLLSPAQRAELDEAIIDGRQTKTALFERFSEALGISYRAFCNYAAQLEARAKHRYIGELLTNVFGNLPDSDIDARAKGVLVAMLDKIAAGALSDAELKTRDLKDLVFAHDLIRRGAIAETQEKRRQAEWDVVRMAGVAEAATWIKRELAAEIGEDEELRRRLDQAVDRCCSRVDKPADNRLSAKLLKEMARKWNWKSDCIDMMQMIWGLDVEAAEDAPKLTETQARQQIRDIYKIQDSAPDQGREKTGTAPSRGGVCDAIDDFMRGKTEDNGSD